MLQLTLACSITPELTFAETDRVETRVGRIMVRIIALTAVFLRPWTVPALLEALAWVSAAQYTLENRDSNEFITLYKSLWWRRVLSACAFIAVQTMTLARWYPPLIVPLFLLGLLVRSLRELYCALAVMCIPGIIIDTPAVEIGMLIGVCLPLWVFGFWDPRWSRALPMAVLYKMQLTALLYEIAQRLEISFTDWL